MEIEFIIAVIFTTESHLFAHDVLLERLCGHRSARASDQTSAVLSVAQCPAYRVVGNESLLFFLSGGRCEIVERQQQEQRAYLQKEQSTSALSTL